MYCRKNRSIKEFSIRGKLNIIPILPHDHGVAVVTFSVHIIFWTVRTVNKSRYPTALLRVLLVDAQRHAV